MARLRIIAGPNGSGKSHLTRTLRSDYNINWGHYINADDIERALRERGAIAFRDFGLEGPETEFLSFYENHSLRAKAPAEPSVGAGFLRLRAPLPAATYFGTRCANYLRQRLMETGKTFPFETVMSGSDKLRLLDQALSLGYRIYVCFVCTENAVINIGRVADRVRKQGHHVPDDLVVNRYNRALENLALVLQKVRRAHLFDNSGFAPELVAEKSEAGHLSFDFKYIPAGSGNTCCNDFKL